jgi:hypothetical protein
VFVLHEYKVKETPISNHANSGDVFIWRLPFGQQQKLYIDEDISKGLKNECNAK